MKSFFINKNTWLAGQALTIAQALQHLYLEAGQLPQQPNLNLLL
jgi:hypothetical protein